MLPVFVINLDRSTDRLARFADRCADAGVAFERFPAINGTDLPDALKPYFCDASGRIVSPLRPAEIGCYASHLGIWQLIVERDLPAAVICEDDAIPQHGFDATIRNILSTLPTGWDMVLLANIPKAAFRPLCDLADGRSLIRYSRIPGGAGCYLISRSGAGKVLQPVAARMWAVDHDTRWPWKFGMDTYGVHPAPVTRYPAVSTINPNGGGRSKLRAGFRRTPHRTPHSFLFNLRQLGPYWWARCFAVNCWVKLRALLVPVTRLPAHALRTMTRA